VSAWRDFLRSHPHSSREPVWIWFVTRSPSRIDLDKRPLPLNGESLAM
jgi:hypothetical protein